MHRCTTPDLPCNGRTRATRVTRRKARRTRAGISTIARIPRDTIRKCPRAPRVGCAWFRRTHPVLPRRVDTPSREMAMTRGFKVAAVAATLALAGCVTAPTGPRVTALPGSAKNYDKFPPDDVL